jgi:hypothetical protein
VRALFDARTHKTMATIRRDGSPRISGMEMQFDDERVTFGLMDGSMKLCDVQRDPRVAFHSPSVDPPDDAPHEWVGEAKLAGRVVSRARAHGAADGGAADGGAADDGGDHFELDVTEVVLTRVGTPPDHLVIESWHPGVGYRRRTRT